MVSLILCSNALLFFLIKAAGASFFNLPSGEKKQKKQKNNTTLREGKNGDEMYHLKEFARITGVTRREWHLPQTA